MGKWQTIWMISRKFPKNKMNCFLMKKSLMWMSWDDVVLFCENISLSMISAFVCRQLFFSYSIIHILFFWLFKFSNDVLNEINLCWYSFSIYNLSLHFFIAIWDHSFINSTQQHVKRSHTLSEIMILFFIWESDSNE